MKSSLFAYGTLEIPEVMAAVTGQSFFSVGATAHGFVRYVLTGKIYPGMISESGASTQGRVYLNVNEQALTLLDEFEDDVYVRKLIDIRTFSGQCLKAFAYLLPEEVRGILSLDCWNKDKFLSTYLKEYLHSCHAFYVETALKSES